MEKLITVADWRAGKVEKKKSLIEAANKEIRLTSPDSSYEEDDCFYVDTKIDKWPTEEEIRDFAKEAFKAGWTRVGAIMKKGKVYLLLYYAEEVETDNSKICGSSES